MKGLPVLSISCVLGTALASGERELRAISFKESVASGGNRPRKQYSNARERILLSQERIYRGEKDSFQQERRSQRCSEAFEGRVPALRRAHRCETRERKMGRLFKVPALLSLAPYRDSAYLQR